MKKLIVGLLVLVTVNCLADVWPNFHNNNQRAGASLVFGPDCCDSGCEVDIEYSYASPVIDGANQNVYMQGGIAASGPWYLWCVNEKDCSVKWTYLLSATMPTGGLQLHSSCSISGDTIIYVGNAANNSLYAIYPDGTLKWSYLMGGRIRSSPIVSSDGTVIYTIAEDGYLYAINSDNTLKWKSITASTGAKYSSPTLSYNDSVIYVGSSNSRLYAFNIDGTTKWVYVTGDEVRSSPAVGVDSIIYFGSYDQYLYALNYNGVLKWKTLLGGNVNSSPAIDEIRGIIYVGSSNNRLNAVNKIDGTIKWVVTLSGNPSLSSPAVALVNNIIYIGDKSNRIYLIENWSDSGKIICTVPYSWEITSPAIARDTAIWFNEYSHKLHKIKCKKGIVGIKEVSPFNVEIKIENSFPNPFEKDINVLFAISKSSFVTFDVYDITGTLIKSLSGNYTAGQHSIIWDAKNSQGNKIKTGLYLGVLKTDFYKVTKKIIFMK